MIDRMRSVVVRQKIACALATLIFTSLVFANSATAQNDQTLSVIGYTETETLIFMDALAFGLSQPGATQTTQVPINGLRAHDWYTVTVARQSSQICPPAQISFDGGHVWQVANEILAGPTAPNVVAEAVSAEIQSRYACSAKANVRQIYDSAVRQY